MKQDERDPKRAASTKETDEDAERSSLDSLKAEMNRVASGAALALEVAGLKTPTRPPGKKSLLASGLLSFFFGPFGWLYAAPLKEAIPVIVVYAIVLWLFQVLPLAFLFMYVIGIVNVASAAAGVLYAWSFNSGGKRLPLVLKEKDGQGGEVRKLLARKK